MARSQRRSADTEVDGNPPSAAAEAPAGDRGGPRAAAPEDPKPQFDDAAGGAAGGAPAGPVGMHDRLQARSEAFSAMAERLHLGPLIAGIILIIFGLLLLGGTDVAWRGLLDAVLGGLGLALIIASRGAGSRRGLVVAGLVLAVVMLGVWRADVPLQGGLRFHTVTPVAPRDISGPLRQTGGTLTIDLTRHQPPPTPTPLQASVGVGRLVVVVLPGTVLQGTAVVGEGRVTIGPVDKNGVGLEVPLAAPNAPARIQANLRVGVGTVEVQIGK